MKNVDWILNNSVTDPNYDNVLPRLTNEELLYCLDRERRKSGLTKLRAEARRRGLNLKTLQSEGGRDKTLNLTQTNKNHPPLN